MKENIKPMMLGLVVGNTLTWGVILKLTGTCGLAIGLIQGLIIGLLAAGILALAF